LRLSGAQSVACRGRLHQISRIRSRICSYSGLWFRLGARELVITLTFPHSRERTGLVARTVFKIAEVVARRLVGSIPTRSRQVKTLPPCNGFRLILRRFATYAAFYYTVRYTGMIRLKSYRGCNKRRPFSMSLTPLMIPSGITAETSLRHHQAGSAAKPAPWASLKRADQHRKLRSKRA
jgi:hypothetical protein